MSGVFAQVKAFTLTLILGVLAGSILHYYQLMIRRARIGKYLLYIIDLVLWIIMLVLVFITIFFINQAEMRLYVLLAMLLGIIIYYHYLSARFYKPLFQAADATVRIIGIMLSGIKKPFYWLSYRVIVLKEKFRRTPPPDPS